MGAEESKGWAESAQLVHHEIRRLADCYEQLYHSYGTICTEIAVLKVKAGVWGLIGGSIPVGITLGVYAVMKLWAN